jgi:hypothetical protein
MYIKVKHAVYCQKRKPKVKKKQRARRKTLLRNRLPHPPIAPWLIGHPSQTLAMESRSDVAGIRLGKGPCEPILARALEDNHAEIRATADLRAFSVLDRCFNSSTPI